MAGKSVGGSTILIKQKNNDAGSFVKYPGLPQDIWRFGYVLCAEFRDWDLPEANQWVEWAEAAAHILGVPARHGTAALKDENRDVKSESAGQWRRIRKRVATTLAAPALSHTMNIDSGYQYIVGEQPSDGYIYLQTDPAVNDKVSKLGIVVANGISSNVGELAEKIKSLFSGRLNARYGAIYRFPMAVSGNYYMMDAGFSSPDVKSLGGNATLDHSRRAGNARSRADSTSPYRNGFVREVFEFNLLSDRHLAAPLMGATVHQYVEAIGTLKPSELIPGLWEWRLNDSELIKARSDWEESGLVLSAPKEPISQ